MGSDGCSNLDKSSSKSFKNMITIALMPQSHKYDWVGTQEELCEKPTRDTFICCIAPVLAPPWLENPVVLAHKSMKLLETPAVLDQKSMKLLEIAASPVSWAEGAMDY